MKKIKILLTLLLVSCFTGCVTTEDFELTENRRDFLLPDLAQVNVSMESGYISVTGRKKVTSPEEIVERYTLEKGVYKAVYVNNEGAYYWNFESNTGYGLFVQGDRSKAEIWFDKKDNVIEENSLDYANLPEPPKSVKIVRDISWILKNTKWREE